jgi:hypothetical protein
VSGVAAVAARPEDSTLEIEIDTATVDTGRSPWTWSSSAGPSTPGATSASASRAWCRGQPGGLGPGLERSPGDGRLAALPVGPPRDRGRAGPQVTSARGTSGAPGLSAPAPVECWGMLAEPDVECAVAAAATGSLWVITGAIRVGWARAHSARREGWARVGNVPKQPPSNRGAPPLSLGSLTAVTLIAAESGARELRTPFRGISEPESG